MAEIDDTALVRPRSQRAKARRRRRRALSFAVYVLIVFALAWFAESRATTTVIFVTNTELALGSDPGLSDTGTARANLLAAFLADVDVLAGLDAIFASDSRATQETAKPIADVMGVDVQIADHGSVEQFMGHVITEYKGRIVLVVTDKDAVPELVAELHGHQSVPEIRADEYDNVYIVTSPWFGKVKTLRLRYGLGWNPGAISH